MSLFAFYCVHDTSAINGLPLTVFRLEQGLVSTLICGKWPLQMQTILLSLVVYRKTDSLQMKMKTVAQ